MCKRVLTSQMNTSHVLDLLCKNVLVPTGKWCGNHCNSSVGLRALTAKKKFPWCPSRSGTHKVPTHYAFTVIRFISFFILSAFMRGDPHITTIDGKSYTFNGLGEYWLISTSNPVTAGAQVQLHASSELR